MKIKDDLGLNPTQQEYVRWAVAGSYYGGFIAGPITGVFSNRILYSICTVLSFIGLMVLAFYTDQFFVGQFNVLIILICLAVVSLCACITTIAAISTILHNFQTNISAILVAMMIAYYMVAPYFEKGVKDGLFSNSSYSTNIIVMAGIQCLTYIAAVFTLQKHNLTYELRKASAVADRLCILIFVLIELVFLTVIYLTCIMAEKWKIGIVFMISLIFANFFTFFITILLINKNLKNQNDDIELESDMVIETSIFQSLRNPNVYGLLLSTFVVVGTGTTFELEVPTVAFAMGEPESGTNVMKLYWISDVCSRLLGGLVSAMLFRVVYKYLLGSVLCLGAMLGFGLVLLSKSGGILFFFMSSILIGASVGGYWTILPQIILSDMNKNSFEVLWGFTININLLGVFLFDKLFMWINDKQEPFEIGTCQGMDCYFASYIASSILGAVAGIAGLLGYASHINRDEEVMAPLINGNNND